MIRIGHGYDVHKLVEGRKLILGGVEIPYEKGLLGIRMRTFLLMRRRMRFSVLLPFRISEDDSRIRTRNTRTQTASNFLKMFIPKF